MPFAFLSTLLGVGLLGLVAYDVYATILHSARAAARWRKTSTGRSGSLRAASLSGSRARAGT